MRNQRTSKDWFSVLKYTTLLALCAGLVVILINFSSQQSQHIGEELELQQLPSNYKIEEINWVNNEDYFERSLQSTHPNITDLPSKDWVYYTNYEFADEYQFAQTSGETWGASQRLFWRQNKSETWSEIELTHQYVSPAGFVEKNGRYYIAATIGLGSRDLYLVDVESGVFQMQFSANGLTVSPDKKKIAYSLEKNEFSGKHSIVVWDLEDDSKTHVSTITEADPGSGISFSYRWSDNSQLLQITGRSLTAIERTNVNGGEFYYLYNHSNKNLFYQKDT